MLIMTLPMSYIKTTLWKTYIDVSQRTGLRVSGIHVVLARDLNNIQKRMDHSPILASCDVYTRVIWVEQEETEPERRLAMAVRAARQHAKFTAFQQMRAGARELVFVPPGGAVALLPSVARTPVAVVANDAADADAAVVKPPAKPRHIAGVAVLEMEIAECGRSGDVDTESKESVGGSEGGGYEDVGDAEGAGNVHLAHELVAFTADNGSIVKDVRISDEGSTFDNNGETSGCSFSAGMV